MSVFFMSCKKTNFTKIIATIGPASDSMEVAEKMIAAGMSVARLNFSHGSYSYFEKVASMIRKLNKNVAIMLDTKGPEIRTGEIKGGSLELKAGDKIVFTNRETKEGTKDSIYLSYRYIGKIKKGSRLLIDDGMIAAEVLKSSKDSIVVRILNSAVLGSRKTVTIQGHNAVLDFLSEKDKRDILFAVKNRFDFIAASFVREASEVMQIKKLLQKHGSDIRVIAKIEHWKAVENYEEIIRASDGIMVARGDLGVEIAMEKVPYIQKRIIQKCNELGKPVIVATQMLESMKSSPRPTRAEVSDVAQAILQGADAIMLSGETASGSYPVEAVKMMRKIAKEYDCRAESRIAEKAEREMPYNKKVAMLVTRAAFHAARQLKAKAIVAPTLSGFTARKLSRFKPHCPIFAITSSMHVVRQLQLSWGVEAFYMPTKNIYSKNVLRSFIRQILDRNILEPDDSFIVASGNKKDENITNKMEIYKAVDLAD